MGFTFDNITNSTSERNKYQVRTAPSLRKQNCMAGTYIHGNLCIACQVDGQ
jgi:hypothetical protein